MTKTEHRPFPLPTNPWVMRQTWTKLLFAHWPIEPSLLSELIPDSIELDLFDGHAWLGVVPFVMNDVVPRYTRPMPGISDFLELNVRTYVIKDGIPGVFFFSLDCSNRVAVMVARKFYHLPYFVAKMSIDHEKGEIVNYTSERAVDKAALIVSYRPTGGLLNSAAASIDKFLTERYCLYTCAEKKKLHRGVIHHESWPLQPAEAEFEVNSMTLPLGIKLPDTKPLLHYSERLETIEWPLSLVSIT